MVSIGTYPQKDIHRKRYRDKYSEYLCDTPALYPALSQGQWAGNPHGYYLKLSTALPFTLPPLLLRVALRRAF